MAPKTKLFVSKLPPTCTDFELKKLFERIGEVTECSVMGNYAFIHMKSEDQAHEAISSLNNWEMGSFRISVEQSTSDKRGGSGGGGGSGRGRGGGMGFRGRGRFPPMRGGGRGGMPPGMGGGMVGGMMGRPGPYDRPPMGGDPYGPPGQPPMRNGYYDDYDRRPLSPIGDRRPMSRDPVSFRDPYDRFDDSRYERMAPLGRRSPPLMDRRMPMGYDRRDPYDDLYRRPLPPPERDMYGSGMDRYGPPRGRSPPGGGKKLIPRDRRILMRRRTKVDKLILKYPLRAKLKEEKAEIERKLLASHEKERKNNEEKTVEAF